ncbi:serine/arginine repetitive matrix protein 2-like [Falco rusticolus]|uniref:serine/arginine repetitive matrix protein 2-like n=1 Tax=Falco rusticolus TaxID=120794 RepID=UPI001886572F|nr:serine/arginine repetitive matrix protein 2-like [Falco rusticolus]
MSPAPSYARSFFGQQRGGRQQADPVGPRDQPDWTKDMAMGMEDSAEDSSSWPGGLSITSHVDMPLHHSCVCRRLESCTRAACPHCHPPFDHVLHTAREDSHQEEHRFSPSSRCQRNGARKRTRSRSPQRRNDLHSCFVETTDCKRSTGRRRRPSPPSCHHTPRDNTAPGPSKRSCQYTPAPRAAPREQTLPMQRARSRSLWHRYDLHRQFTEYHPSAAGMRKRGNEVILRRANPAVLSATETEGWTERRWQERPLLPVVSAAPESLWCQ